MNALKAYSKNYKKVDVSKDSETTIWNAYITSRDRDLHEKLVEMYLPLVVNQASRMSIRVRQHVEKEELIGAGVMGLHNAISSFKPGEGVQFSTFANLRIKGSIIDELRKQDHLTRNQRKKYKDICQTISELTNELGRCPTLVEVGAKVDLSESEVQNCIGMASNALSIDSKNSQGVSYYEVIEDEMSDSPWETADNKMNLELMRDAFKLLPERDQQLLYLRHYKDLRTKEIAEVMNISEGRVSQIYKEIIVKLRGIMNVED
ncbi:MAG: FliA/WhiG family RNA polymerase sigma factor [Lentisphaeraceae bacterium]|nr:FliA/WhiG family RNA polymerase sigma factor [Lentisphaeraceae bacterium]